MGILLLSLSIGAAPPSLCASVDRLNIVAVWIEHECGIAAKCVLLAQSRLPVVDPAGLQAGGVEGVDLRSAFGCEGSMLFDGMRMKAIDPEHRMVQAVSMSEVEMWRDLPDGAIEFTMRRLRTAD
jgi:hypothetical protein